MNWLKKILFPFYKERHHFLMGKWWFRLLFTFYLIGFIAYPLHAFNEKTDNSWCYGFAMEHNKYGTPEYEKAIDNCSFIQSQSLKTQSMFVPIFTLFWHYLFQLVLFKVVIDFIAGIKKKYD